MVDINSQILPLDSDGMIVPLRTREQPLPSLEKRTQESFSDLAHFEKSIQKSDTQTTITADGKEAQDTARTLQDFVLLSDEDNTGRIKVEVVNNQVVRIVANGLGIEEDRLPHTYINKFAIDAYEEISSLLEKERLVTIAQ